MPQLLIRSRRNYRPSKAFSKDPTGSLSLERAYEKELKLLFLHFKNGVIRSFKISAGIREMESPPINVPMFVRSLDQLAQIIVNAGAPIVNEHTVKAYNHGTTFAQMILKKSGRPQFKWMPDKPPVSFMFTGPNTATYEAMLHNNLGDLTKATEDVKNLIKREMLTGVEKSETTLQIMRRIRDAADLGTQRATLIARTEVMKAVNQGAAERYKEAGVQMEWLTTHDELLCEECAARDGEVVTTDLPPLHPRCRCCVIPVAYGSE